MPDYFTQGFAVRTPSWHRKEVLLPEFITDIAQMQRLAGHNFTVIAEGIGEVVAGLRCGGRLLLCQYRPSGPDRRDRHGGAVAVRPRPGPLAFRPLSG